MNGLREFFDVDESRGWLRTVGGALVATGLLLVWIRRGSGAYSGGWGEGPLFGVLLVTFAFLYGSGMRLRSGEGEPSGWQTASLVFGVIVLVPTLDQFVDLIGGNPDADLNQAWILFVTAAAGAAAAVVARVRYGLLLAGLALILSWLSLWDEILTNGLGAHLGTTRGLLMVAALSLLAGAAAVRFGRAGVEGIRASELVTAAGVAAVAGAGLLSLSAFVELAAAAPSAGFFGSFLPSELPVAEPTWFWNLVLLGSSVALIAFAARFGVRGPGYVGGIGLILFIVLEGFDLDALINAIEEGATSPPGGELIWWPLLLIIVGAAAFIASFGSAAGDALSRLGPPREQASPPPPSAADAPPPPPPGGEAPRPPKPPPAA